LRTSLRDRGQYETLDTQAQTADPFFRWGYSRLAVDSPWRRRQLSTRGQPSGWSL